jgi:hypothetical protein
MEYIVMSIEAEPLLRGIHNSFTETEYGQTLAGQVRYERYKPEHISNERWTELLGADVNNLTHMPLTFGLTRVMVTQLRLTQPRLLDTNEENLLGAAAIIHDWAEAVVGDISYSDKTDDNKAEEKEQLTAILASFEGTSAQDAKALIDRAAQEVVFAPDTKLGHIFNTVERAGYMRTALRAAHHVIQGTAPDCEEGLRWIVADVFGNHTAALVERTSVYLPVNGYLNHMRNDISRAFGIVSDGTFLNYEENQRLPKQEAFHKASETFQSWLGQSTEMNMRSFARNDAERIFKRPSSDWGAWDLAFFAASSPVALDEALTVALEKNHREGVGAIAIAAHIMGADIRNLDPETAARYGAVVQRVTTNSSSDK